jgi:alpha-galactosidase
LSLASDSFELEVNPQEGSWSVRTCGRAGFELEGAQTGLAWRDAKGRHLSVVNLQGVEARQAEPGQSDLGHIRSLILELPPDARGLAFTLERSLPLRLPLLLWRLTARNRSGSTIRLDQIELLRTSLAGPKSAGSGSARARPREARLSLRGTRWPDPEDRGFFTNGWQSWNYAGALGSKDRFPRTRLGPLTSPARVNAGTAQPKGRGHFGSDMFGVLGSRSGRTGILVGFLSQRQAFGSLEADLRGHSPFLRLWANTDGIILPPGRHFTTDWACLQPVELDAEDPMGPCLEAVARENGARADGPVPVGWCSWYTFFQDVSQQDVLSNLEWASRHRSQVPLRLIQLDDGFEAEVGDWHETNGRFPDGLTSLNRSVRLAGFRPGLWLAPFVAKPTARIVQEHPDWILRGRRGRPVNPGLLWDTFPRALDVTHPEVLEDVRRLIRTATRDWGFDYLKLDFLFAGVLPGRRHDPTVTRAQALRQALSCIRQEAGPEVTLLGCGCPLGSGVGIFDAMRISADVAPGWTPSFHGIEPFFRQEPDFPSARNAIRNTLTRAPLHRRWWVNDPDCLLLRGGQGNVPQSTDTASKTESGRASEPAEPAAPAISGRGLTTAETQSLATVIALSAGSLIVSDDLPRLTEERSGWLARLIPPLPRAARVVDWFDSAYPARLVLPLAGAAGKWHLVALLNWEMEPRDLKAGLDSLGLPAADLYHVVDFWCGRYRRISGDHLSCPAIPPHGVCLMAVRPVASTPLWLGDTLHISQGLCVQSWIAGPSGLSVDLELGRRGRGVAWLALPEPPLQATLSGRAIAWKADGEGVYALDLTVEDRGRLEVRLG